MSHEEEGNAGNVGNEQQKTVLSLLKHSISSKDDAIHILNALLEKNRFTIDEVHALLESKEAGDVQKNGKSEASISNTNDNNNKSTSKKKRKKKAKKAKQGSYMTRHIAFRFHYDGATYNGLAENRNCPTDNSVEKILFAALEKTCLIDPEEEDGGGTENILLIENNNNIDCNDTAKATETSNVLNNSRKQCKYSRSGRTDKGVSAFGQVVALKVRSAFPVGVMIKTNAGSGPNKHVVTEDALPNNSSSPLNCWVSSSSSSQTKSSSRHVEKETLQNRTITEKNFCQMLNNVLPPTIRILGWSPVSKDFSARFSTSSRTYRYFFIQRNLKLDDMQKALDYMVGTHDFRNLCKMNCEEVDNFVRVINYAKIVRTQPRELIKTDDMLNECSTHDVEFRVPCYFEIQGQAFLWHQIRCIASILFMIGKGDESPSVVKELLDIKTNPAKPSYPFAPEMPLVLHKCEYKNLEFGHSVHNLWRVSCDLEKKWEDLTLAAERIRNGMNSLSKDAMVATSDVIEFITVTLAERKKKVSRSDVYIRGHKNVVDHQELSTLREAGSYMSWGDALIVMHKYGIGKPGADGHKVLLHIPLMHRAKGTTYEEKIQSILGTDKEGVGAPPSKRRREVYEKNIKKKKISKPDDAKFYKKMLCEGGSGL